MPSRAASSSMVALLVILVIGVAAIGYFSSPGEGSSSVLSVSPSVASITTSSSLTTDTHSVSQKTGPPVSATTGPSQSTGNGGCTPSQTGTILVRGSLKGFAPSILNITVGQTVTFTMGPMIVSCAFNHVGTFIYHCADHPFMIVTVNVEQ